MLIIELPPDYREEQTYIAGTLLRERLGLDVRFGDVRFGPESGCGGVRIHDGCGRELRVAADLFTRPRAGWLTPACLPREPLAWWDIPDIGADLAQTRLPVLYGTGTLTRGDGTVDLGLDVFGTAFFMLSRLEEVVVPARDGHDRFPASEALAFRHGFLNRPVVDEAVEVLWACLRLVWPGLERRRRDFRHVLSHDVDMLRRYERPLRLVAGNLIRRRDPGQAWADLAGWARIRLGGAADPYDTFDQIMDVSEAAGQTSAFYFITDWTCPTYDRGYRFDSPPVRALLRRIAARGHEIGLHTSYGTFLDAGQTRREFEILLRVCDEEGIRQDRWGGRQHYLRWRTPVTFQNWDDAGLAYDSTLSFADAAGFRCGTCHEFPVFNVLTGRALALRERPLVSMECSVLDPRYQGLGAGPAALAEMKRLKDLCRHYRGDFTLLWHNNRLAGPAEAALFRDVVAA
jgi:hypothetical protein